MYTSSENFFHREYHTLDIETFFLHPCVDQRGDCGHAHDDDRRLCVEARVAHVVLAGALPLAVLLLAPVLGGVTIIPRRRFGTGGAWGTVPVGGLVI